ncbi:MAG TPA: YaaR family protein [Clostridiales bacterium]|nr:YaaR family protein [Clostridiales bacterium]
MKIEETLNNRPNLTGMVISDVKKEVEADNKTFQGSLKQAEYKSYEEKLNQLADRIFEQSKKLEKRMDIKEYIVYKRSISEFMNEFLNNSYKFSRQNMMDRRGNYRTYSVVKKINSELDVLAKDLLENQQDKLKVLQRLDYIRGLILDMLM